MKIQKIKYIDSVSGVEVYAQTKTVAYIDIKKICAEKGFKQPKYANIKTIK